MKPYLLVACLLFSACSAEKPGVLQLSGNTMGTQFTVKLPAGTPRADADSLQLEIENVLGQMERQMSTYLSDSEISRFNVSDSTAWYGVSEEFCRTVERALAVSEMTTGAFDITVGPLVNLWGFGPDGVVLEPPSDEQIATAKKRTGYAHLRTDCSVPALRKDIENLYVDMSAIAKGHAVDRIAELLDKMHIADFLVEIGGELRLRGHNAAGEKWAIAIEAPQPQERAVYSIVRLTDAALATSGDYRNYFEFAGRRYSHTIDVRTGYPVSHQLASVTVVDDEAGRADALATALLALGPDEAMALATRQGIAAFFLLRGDAGIEELSSPAFASIRHES